MIVVPAIVSIGFVRHRRIARAADVMRAIVFLFCFYGSEKVYEVIATMRSRKLIICRDLYN